MYNNTLNSRNSNKYNMNRFQLMNFENIENLQPQNISNLSHTLPIGNQNHDKRQRDFADIGHQNFVPANKQPSCFLNSYTNVIPEDLNSQNYGFMNMNPTATNGNTFINKRNFETLSSIYKDISFNALNEISVKRSKKPKIESKDPKVLLNELRPDIRMEEISINPFTYRAVIDDNQYQAVGRSKKLAKTALAEKILVEHLKYRIPPQLEKKSNPLLSNYTTSEITKKNPISLLYELHDGRNLNIEIKQNEGYKIPIFVANVSINGNMYSAKGLSKHKAKITLSKNILKECYNVELGINDEEAKELEKIAELEKILDTSTNATNELIATKTPSAILYEIMKHETTVISCPTGGFTGTINAKGKEYKSWGSSKKLAKNEVAKLVLKDLNIDFGVFTNKIAVPNEIDLSMPTTANISNINFPKTFSLITSTLNDSFTTTEPNDQLEDSNIGEVGDEVTFRKIPYELADLIALTVLNKYKEIMQMGELEKILFDNSKMIAGIVMMRQMVPNTLPQLTLIAVSNGTRCFDAPAIFKMISEEEMRDSNLPPIKRKCITDCHAENLCRKALIKFLWAQISAHDDDNNIFEKIPVVNSHSLFKLKSNVKFLLYLSGFPCGSELRIPFKSALRMNQIKNQKMPCLKLCPGFSKTRNSDKLLIKSNYVYPLNNNYSNLDNQNRDGNQMEKNSDPQNINGKVGGDTGYDFKKSFPNFNTSKQDSKVEEFQIVMEKGLGIMSCADKLMLWNIVGVQGDELTQFIQPIFFNGIITSTPYPLTSLYKAIYGRSLYFLRPECFSSIDTYLNPPIIQKTTYRFIPNNKDTKNPNIYNKNHNKKMKKKGSDIGGNAKIGDDNTSTMTEDKPSLDLNMKEDMLQKLELNQINQKILISDNIKTVNDINKIDDEDKTEDGMTLAAKKGAKFLAKRKFKSNPTPNFVKHNRYAFVWYRTNMVESESKDNVLEILDCNRGFAFGDVSMLQPLALSICEETKKKIYAKILENKIVEVDKDDSLNNDDQNVLKIDDSELNQSLVDKKVSIPSPLKETIKMDYVDTLKIELMKKLDEMPVINSSLSSFQLNTFALKVKTNILVNSKMTTPASFSNEVTLYKKTKLEFKRYCDQVLKLGTWAK
ncbi:uncharacterized protein LOC135923293 isoform X2 [Gordionus sp. m RMFG-2023]|uniref:uncharacterized protein LOC135923293 isoform X2 n=1 Tax=Gordionus sp. m RMFG-2023 TaxID=3053472 RepID=UPI0031FDCED6